MRHLSIILSVSALTACSTIDTGAVDYRRAERAPTSQEVAERVTEYLNEDCRPQESTNNPQICEPLLGARLFRKNTSLGTPIANNDIYSIRLDHGFMHYVSEIHLTPSRILDAKSPFVPQAEIVVLARAFEFSGDSNTTEGFAELAGQSSLNSAKVIYYSPDVEHRQSLNFSNIPLLGPAQYQGRPVGIQIIVLELDRVSDEMRGLLDSLASLGQSSEYLGGGTAAKVLFTLGKSLLENNNDDIIFAYRFVLDPVQSANQTSSAGFEEGRYVLRRIHHRRNAAVWRNLELDHNTGQLFLVDRKGLDAPCEGRVADICEYSNYTDETYFTLNIFKNTGSQAASYIHQMTLGDLNTSLKEKVENRNDGFGAAANALNVLAEEARSTFWAERLSEDWEAVNNATTSYVRFGLHPDLQNNLFDSAQSANDLPADNSICFLENFDQQKSIAAMFDITSGVGNFTDHYTEAQNDRNPPKTGETVGETLFQNEQRRTVLRAVSNSLIAPSDTNIPVEVQSISAFETAYIGTPDKNSALRLAVVNKATERLATNCGALVLNGKARRPISSEVELINSARGGDQEAIDKLLQMNLVYD